VVEKIYPAGPGYDLFKHKIRKQTGIDLDMYKYQIHRRVHTLMKNWKIENYEDYYNILVSSDTKQRKFLDYITINVTEFFRNPERWKVLENKVINYLKNNTDRTVNLWSAGCSYGQEAYSLAIFAMENDLSCKVLAVDVDEGVLSSAKTGVYGADKLVNIPETIRERYFQRLDSGNYQVSEKVKKRVTFRHMNLVDDEFPRNMHLILCRNVVIYFSEKVKAELYERFFRSLAPGGFLMIGTTEQIFRYSIIGFEAAGSFLYRKPDMEKRADSLTKREQRV